MLGTRRAPQGTALLAGTALRATRMEQRVPNPSSAGKKKQVFFCRGRSVAYLKSQAQVSRGTRVLLLSRTLIAQFSNVAELHSSSLI